jgi:hypothetical protein
MKWYKASFDGFLPPEFYNDRLLPKEGVIESEGKILLSSGYRLSFNPEGVPYPIGTKVVVLLQNWFWFLSEDDYLTMQQQSAEERSRHEEEVRQRSIAKRLEAEKFNAAFSFPFKWEVGIKPVLTKLTDSSWGDGAYARTVYHVLVMSPLHEGRLKRRAGDFLCTPFGGSNGFLSDHVTPLYNWDANRVKYKPKITCKACLKIAERWQTNGF